MLYNKNGTNRNARDLRNEIKQRLKNNHKPYLVQYVCKDDGHKGQGYRYDTLEQAEKAKADMEKAWGAQLWDVVITND